MNTIPWLKQKTEKQLAKKARRLKKHLGRDDYYLDKTGQTMAKNSLYRLQLRNKPTKAEIIVGDYLYENKIHFQFQRGFIVPFHRIVDFYIPRRNIIIEVDGGYHNEIEAKDRRKDELWSEQREMTTIRILNEEVYNGSFKEKLYTLTSKIS